MVGMEHVGERKMVGIEHDGDGTWWRWNMVEMEHGWGWNMMEMEHGGSGT